MAKNHTKMHVTMTIENAAAVQAMADAIETLIRLAKDQPWNEDIKDVCSKLQTASIGMALHRDRMRDHHTVVVLAGPDQSLPEEFPCYELMLHNFANKERLTVEFNPETQSVEAYLDLEKQRCQTWHNPSVSTLIESIRRLNHDTDVPPIPIKDPAPVTL